MKYKFNKETLNFEILYLTKMKNCRQNAYSRDNQFFPLKNSQHSSSEN